MPVSKKLAQGAHHIAYARKGIIEKVMKKPVVALTADYTERQLQIISGDIPIEDVRLNELSLLIRKATDPGDTDILETATFLREPFIHKDDPQLKCSEENAEDVLASLEPEWLRQLKKQVQSNPTNPFNGIYHPQESSVSHDEREYQDEDEKV